MTYLFVVVFTLLSGTMIHIFCSAGFIVKSHFLLVYTIFQLDYETPRTEKVSQGPSQHNLHLEELKMISGFYYWNCWEYEINVLTVSFVPQFPHLSFLF